MSEQFDVEIKINLAGDFPVAAQKLGLKDKKGDEGELYFLDDVTPAPHPLPVLQNGIVLRIRSKGDNGDVTVKLRPCYRSQLPAHWLRLIAVQDEDAAVEFKMQQDWSGERHSLAVSATVDVEADNIADAIGHQRPSSLFMAEQLEFLEECGAVPVYPARLTVLGPIGITRWKKIPFADFQLNAERWQLGKLDRLELSIVEDLDEAAKAQADLLEAVIAAGLTVDTSEQNKTEMFLTALAKRVPDSG